MDHTGILRKEVHDDDDDDDIVTYTYKGRCDRTWWDSHAIWNPYAEIAWEHEVGTPWPATKRPVVTRHDNDPDADPKPTFDEISDIHRRWQARARDDNGDDNGGDGGG